MNGERLTCDIHVDFEWPNTDPRKIKRLFDVQASMELTSTPHPY